MAQLADMVAARVVDRMADSLEFTKDDEGRIQVKNRRLVEHGENLPALLALTSPQSEDTRENSDGPRKAPPRFPAKPVKITEMDKARARATLRKMRP